MKLSLALPILLAPLVVGADAYSQDGSTIDEAETHALPNGIPGTFDPATGRFTPLPPAPLATFTTVEGVIRVRLNFRFNSSIHEFDSVFCTVYATFGNDVNGSFYSNHSIRVSVNFAAGIPDTGINLPYTYTPNSINARVDIETFCSVMNSSGTTYSDTDYSPYRMLSDIIPTRAHMNL